MVKTGLMVCAWSKGGSKYDAGRKSVWRESKLCKPQGRGMLILNTERVEGWQYFEGAISTVMVGGEV